MSFATKKANFPTYWAYLNSFCFSRMRTSQNLDFLRIYFDLSLSLSFFPLPFFFVSSFLANFTV